MTAKTKGSKGFKSKANGTKANDQRVAKIIEENEEDLVVMQDFTQKMHKTPHCFFALRKSLAAGSEKIANSCAEAEGMLPAGHPALAHIGHARESLKALDRFMEISDSHEEADNANPASWFLRIVGRIASGIIAEYGRHAERAELALGQHPSFGYLDGYGLEGNDMRYVTKDERELLHTFKRLSEENQGAVCRIVTDLNKREEQEKRAA